MGPIAVHRLICRLRRRLLGLLAVLALASVVVLHHSEMPVDDASWMPTTPGLAMSMGGGHHDPGTTSMSVCVGAFVALGAAIAASGIGVMRLGRWRPPGSLEPPQLRRSYFTNALTRAGPPGATVLGVWRI